MNMADGTSLLIREEQNQRFHTLSEKITSTTDAFAGQLHHLTDLQQESGFVNAPITTAELD